MTDPGGTVLQIKGRYAKLCVIRDIADVSTAGSLHH
jgi:hypothetical protein